MRKKPSIILLIAVAIICMLFAIYGKSVVAYSPLIGWSGALIFITISIIFMLKRR